MEFDELLIPLGKATGINEFAMSKRVEGKITRLTYEASEGHSTLEVFQSYKQALIKNGFEILFSCSLEDCGPHLNFQKLERPFIIDRDHRYLAVKGTLPQGEVYVTVRVYTTARKNPPVRAMISIAEDRPLEEGLVKVNAKAMAEAIKMSGHVAVHGVYFDTDKAEIKPASETTLREMAKLLKENLQLKVYIVGHTDNVGGLRHNMDLSQRRAEAVVQALMTRYNVDLQRIVSKGVGPFAPVTSNKTKDGRARNRRVELVEQ
jgi:outer membrane protein OmpA-like peptidoglycan-associated protein